MDNTELHYVTYDSEAIWNDMIQSYVDAGGDVLYPGDEKEMILRSVLFDIVQVFAGVDNALRMGTLRYAVGDYLDVLGESRGCPRIAPASATATVTITGQNITSDVEIEAGTEMTADGKVFYYFPEAVTLTALQTTVSAQIEAVEDGAEGNALRSGMSLDLSIKNDSVASIVATTSAAGGDDGEDDDTYRERIRTHMTNAVTTGPKQQYEAAAMAVSSEITDANAVNGGGGIVNVYLALKDDADENTIIDAVEEALNDGSVRPLTDTVNVALANDVPYTLNVKYRYDGSSATHAAIIKAVEESHARQDGKIAAPFNPDGLRMDMYIAGATYVAFDAGSNFNGGPVQWTEIGPDERCKGAINLTVV